MTPTQKSDMQKEFAAYLKKAVEQLSEIPMEFRETQLKITVATIRNYCVRILKESKETDKIQAIKQFYNLTGTPHLAKEKLLEMSEMDKLIRELEDNKDKARPIVNLFGNATHEPNENTLSFAALLFDIQIRNIDEFKKWKDTTSLSIETIQEKPPTLTETTPVIEPLPQEAPLLAVKETVEENSNDFAKENSQKEQSTPKSLSFWQQHEQKIAIAASLVFLIVGSAFVYKYRNQQQELKGLQNYIADKQTKLAYIEHITFKPLIADSAFIEAKPIDVNQSVQKDKSSSKKAVIQGDLVFYTNNIYNGKFLYTTDKWNFETDVAGEDMNSKYGEPYCDKLKSLLPLSNKMPTIANKNIWIRFNVLNNSTQKLYIDNIKLEKVAIYSINSQQVRWANWITPKTGEKRFDVVLSHEPSLIPIVVFSEIAPNTPQHFSININCDATCENYMYRFKLVVSANDGQGKRYEVSSDKIYTVGFVREL